MANSDKIQVVIEDEQIKLQIAEFEAKQELILSSDIPAFFSQDPSTF